MFSRRLTTDQLLRKMEHDWDERARSNARHFVATGQRNWRDEEFFASGEQTVAQQILTDMENICQGKEPNQMRVIEIGCGAGRVTRALARLFGEVHAVDVSSEMVAHARRALQDLSNAQVYKNNGMDLSVVPELPFDFAFSMIVFQHIPSYEIIENYIREVHRLLGPGRLFKFQVRGNVQNKSKPDNTWVGVAFSEQQAQALARRCDFDPLYSTGAGTQDFWLWFFKGRR